MPLIAELCFPPQLRHNFLPPKTRRRLFLDYLWANPQSSCGYLTHDIAVAADPRKFSVSKLVDGDANAFSTTSSQRLPNVFPNLSLLANAPSVRDTSSFCLEPQPPYASSIPSFIHTPHHAHRCVFWPPVQWDINLAVTGRAPRPGAILRFRPGVLHLSNFVSHLTLGASPIAVDLLKHQNPSSTLRVPCIPVHRAAAATSPSSLAPVSRAHGQPAPSAYLLRSPENVSLVIFGWSSLQPANFFVSNFAANRWI
ncbi:hypothetical protein FB451DRAFT_1415228 [Mycena latifolia]|nr:hypothetical protein FB451DRAFT_1415228 [Mycena latifolia]